MEFRRSIGPGRPRAYCSQMCRRTAQKELRVAQQRLARFEALVIQLRADVSAFTASAEEEPSNPDHLQEARQGLVEARGAMPFLSSSQEPGARAFVRLLQAVAAFVEDADSRQL